MDCQRGLIRDWSVPNIQEGTKSTEGLKRELLPRTAVAKSRLLLASVVDEGGNLKAGIELELLENVVHVALYGERGDVELLGNLFVAHALGDQVDDLAFAFGQAGR